MTINLQDTSTTAGSANGNVLTALFFDATSALPPVSAALDGSTVVNTSVTNIVADVGEGWVYNGIDQTNTVIPRVFQLPDSVCSVMLVMAPTFGFLHHQYLL